MIKDQRGWKSNIMLRTSSVDDVQIDGSSVKLDSAGEHT